MMSQKIFACFQEDQVMTRRKKIITTATVIILILLLTVLLVCLPALSSESESISIALFVVIFALVVFIFLILMWVVVQYALDGQQAVVAKKVKIITVTVIFALSSVVAFMCSRVGFFTGLYIIGGVDAAICIMFRSWISVRRPIDLHVRDIENQLDSEGDDISVDSSYLTQLARLPRRYRHKEIKAAIRKFPIPVGKGGYGLVFKGELDGSTVAVKMIKEGEEHGDSTFLAELASIASVQHNKLVHLLGYCLVKGGYRYLVYDFFKNGSLDNWIFRKGGEGENCLSWALRYQVAEDVADALAYLHHSCSPRILHLDIKPENILLDENFHARVSDFGLSRLMKIDESKIFTKLCGTWGYMPPEQVRKKVISDKSDVYSYGMLLLELVGGRRNMLFEDNSLNSYFPKIVMEKMKEDKLMDVVDEKLLRGEGVQEMELKVLVYVALWCIQEKPEHRPSMDNVVSMLKGSEPVSKPPETRMFMLNFMLALRLDAVGGDDTAQDATPAMEIGFPLSLMAADSCAMSTLSGR